MLIKGGGLSKVHMVEEGGTPKVHIDPHGGGWGVKKGSPKKMKLQSKTFY